MDSDKALDIIKETYTDGFAEINGRKYEFSKTTHKKRRSIFAFYSKIASLVQNGDFSFLDWAEWDTVETKICEMVMIDGMQLSKKIGHWDKHPSDYIQFISVALPVISYPFFAVNG